METEILFAKIAIKNGACTKEQVQEALDRISRGTVKASTVSEALVELGFLPAETAAKILKFLEGYKPPGGEPAAPASPDAEPGAAEPAALEPAAPPGPDAAADDPRKTLLAPFFLVCAQCGREIPGDDPAAKETMTLFGEAYCPSCVGEQMRLFRLQDARHVRVVRKMRISYSAEPLPGTESEAETESPPPAPREAPAAAGKAEEAAPPPPRPPAAPVPPPPPLPKVGSVEEISEDDLNELQKLAGKGRRDLALSRLARILHCGAKEAEDALKTLEEKGLASEGPPSKGLLGFARDLRRRASFSLNASLGNWAKVAEEGEAWLGDEPDNVDVLNQVGVAWREQGALDRAEARFRKAADRRGANPEPLRNLAHVLVAARKWPEAIRRLEELAAGDGGREEDLRALALACVENGEPERALGPLETLLGRGPADALDLAERKLDILYRAGRKREAREALEGLVDLEGRPWDRGARWAEKLVAEATGSAKAWRQMARILDRRGQAEAAREAVRRALALKPGEPASLKRAASLAARLGRTGEAVARLRELFAAGKGDRGRRLDLAGHLRASGRLEEAVAELRAWTEEGEAQFGGLVLFGRILDDLGRVDEAREVLRRAGEAGGAEAKPLVEALDLRLLEGGIEELLARLQPSEGGARTHLDLARRFRERAVLGPAISEAMRAASSGDPEAAGEAAGLLEEIYASRPPERRIAFFLAGHRRGRGDAAGAARVLGRFREAAPHDPEATRLLLDLLLEAGKREEALRLAEALVPFGEAYREPARAALERLRAEAPDEPRIPLALAGLLEDAGDTAGAIARIREFAALHPDGAAEQARRMAGLLEETGDTAGMLEWAEKALAAGPAALLLRLSAARSYFERGALEDAERHLRAVLEGDPGNRTAKSLLDAVEAQKRDLEIARMQEKWGAEPENAVLGLELAKGLREAGRKEESVGVLQRARSDPESGWKAMEALYSHYRAEGDFGRALTCLRELMARRRPARDSKEWKEITYRMGVLHLSLADPVHAGRAFFDIFKTDPGFRDVAARMEMVEIMEELLDPSWNGPPVPWFLGTEGKIEGPFDLTTVKERIDTNLLAPDDLVWKPGFSGWKRCSEADKISLLFKYREHL